MKSTLLIGLLMGSAVQAHKLHHQIKGNDDKTLLDSDIDSLMDKYDN